MQYANSIEEEKTLWDKISADSVTREEYEVFCQASVKSGNFIRHFYFWGFKRRFLRATIYEANGKAVPAVRQCCCFAWTVEGLFIYNRQYRNRFDSFCYYYCSLPQFRFLTKNKGVIFSHSFYAERTRENDCFKIVVLIVSSGFFHRVILGMVLFIAFLPLV